MKTDEGMPGEELFAGFGNLDFGPSVVGFHEKHREGVQSMVDPVVAGGGVGDHKSCIF